MIPTAIDWSNTFQPAVWAFIHGQPIYGQTFFNPPWVLVPLIPFAVLPPELGRLLLLLCSILLFGLVAYRLKVKPLGLILFFLTPFVFDSLAWGNIEAIALLGLAMPVPAGLVLLVIKPQITLGVIVFLLWRVVKSRDARRIVTTFLPLVVVLAGSIVMYGAWWSQTLSYTQYIGSSMNLALFPLGIPLGLSLLIQSIRTQDIRLALACSPFFFPVVTPQCWLVVFLALATQPLDMLVGTLLTNGYVALVQLKII